MADVIGVAKAMANLKKLSGDLAAATGAAHKELAEQAANEMRANAPVDSGELLSTIRVESPNPFRTEVIVGDETTFYLGFQEFGTVNQQARPFVRPAAANAESVHGSVMLSQAKRRIK